MNFDIVNYSSREYMKNIISLNQLLSSLIH